MAHRLLLLQSLAPRRYLGEHQPSYPRTSEGSLEKEPSTQRRNRGFPVGEDHRSGRRRAWLRRRQEDQGPQAPPTGGHRGFRAKSQSPQRQGDGLGRDQDATVAGGYAVSSP